MSAVWVVRREFRPARLLEQQPSDTYMAAVEAKGGTIERLDLLTPEMAAVIEAAKALEALEAAEFLTFGWGTAFHRLEDTVATLREQEGA